MRGAKVFSIEKEAIGRATKRLRDLLGENLVAVIAFGSRVRGDFTGESDFDILVVVKKRDFYVIDTVNDLFGEEEEKTGIPFSAVIKTLDVYEKEGVYNTTFYRNLRKEGVTFYG